MAIRHLPAGFKPLRNQCGLKFDIQQVCEETGTGTGDPYWDDVYLLLGFEEPAGSTTVTDEGPLGTAVDLMGAATSHDASRFGLGALADPLYGGVLTFGYPNLELVMNGAASLTVEAWVYLYESAGIDALLLVGDTLGSSGAGSYFQVELSRDSLDSPDQSFFRFKYRNASGLLESGYGLSFFNEPAPSLKTAYEAPPNQWAHLMLVFDSDRLYVFLNGRRAWDNHYQFPGTPYLSLSTVPLPTAWGQRDVFFFGTGVDELRVTAGVARATEPFEPPTAPFPRSA